MPERKQVALSFHHKKGAVFATVNFLQVENLEGSCEKIFVPIPEAVVFLLRMDAAGSITIPVGLDIRVNQITTIVADAHFRYCFRQDAIATEFV